MRTALRSNLFFLPALLGCLAFSLPNHALGAEISKPGVATFSAWDNRFEGPDTIPGGQVTIRLRNRGQEPHQLQLLKLDEGKSPADLAASLREGGGVVPRWAKHMGGPNGIGAGDTSEATMYLDPGSYVIICGIPTKNHQTHAALGMQKALVVAKNAPAPPEFYGNFHMAMFDYEFVVVQPLKKGRHTFYVINRGSQTHQASLVRLNPGASAQDVLAALEQNGPRFLPGKLIGGISGLEPGGDGTFTAEFTPGRYAIICLFPDPTARDSHAAKGMVMNFTIE
jgi:sulfocyanin SoxE-like protein